ncbi:MAG: hypothetical protein JRN15_03195 [Nitrososphaerota archaeon]|nr:hypothetical protein [Nitrososphaerota archaeon]
MQYSPASPPSETKRSFRVLLVIVLVVMTVQGWFGDTVNIFVAPVTGISPPAFSMSAFFQTVQSYGFLLIYHAYEGIALIFLSAIASALAFQWSPKRSVRICVILGFIFVASAAVGGYLFVLSGFSNGGNSAQMGGSFIGAYAFYFLTLYYAK